ncbi:uncharacterized protein SOCE26_064310 [Sorangium cellulosum]|uniref:Uncharacterized protein n=1 Tax=Sorangium cellulosum TaxID=56 RepID=A0A2L0F087_SORCE|nr:uncharacterized protein SOCE26_064310 [Sorangium cellulosum]
MHRVLTHGQLAAELRALSEQRFRPPGAHSTRSYSVPTLERWLYAYRSAGLDGLRPQLRSDRGFAQELSEELRTLLLDIRREHPDARHEDTQGGFQLNGRFVAISRKLLETLHVTRVVPDDPVDGLGENRVL